MTYKQDLTKRLEKADTLEEKLKIIEEAQQHFETNNKERRVVNGEIVDPAEALICEGCS
jgi:hypothetical protein|uniref:Uncharacterized protein n=1 Tax=Podoviridae sp. ctdDI2 TaxID=2826567 RepID=A0A8S5NR12_9CAUD|nr:MAG TPA: hypothetical protein [Podoviridae sp. ctdDI2]